MKVERSVSGKLSSSPTNKVRGECEELEYSESEEESEDAGSDSDSDEKESKTIRRTRGGKVLNRAKAREEHESRGTTRSI